MKPGIYPFWFWNDRLNVKEIRWQIQQMAEQGVRGFFIHSRQGLGQPYLSNAFFEMVDAAVDEAKAHGMVANLYDEYPYPSGVAGGEAVLGSPELRATELVQRGFDVRSGDVRIVLPAGKILAARAYPRSGNKVAWTRPLDLLPNVGMLMEANSYLEQGLTGYNQKRYFASQPTPVLEASLPPGEWRIEVSAQLEVTRHKYWGYFLDVLNPDAVRAFLQMTHERYAARYQAEFGNTIRAIFTDETRPSWSACLPGLFRARYDYDLIDHLPALRDPSFPDALRIRGDFDRLLFERFIETFEQPVAEWCQSHGIAYCGEKPYLRFGQMRYMDIPGCEPGHTKAGAPLDLLGPNPRGNARATASAAYFYGKQGALDECYHSLGWSGTLQDARLLADAMILLGIDYLVPHGFFYSTHGLRKHDAPPTFFFQMPYWPMFKHLSQRIERIYERFAGTHIDAQVFLVDPGSGQQTQEDKQEYVRLQHILLEHHIEFLHVDTDLLEECRVENGKAILRDVAVPVVLVPPMQFHESRLVEWLDAFKAQGGTVLVLKRGFHFVSLLDWLQGVNVVPFLDIRKKEGRGPSVWAVHRKSNERDVWFLLNPSDKPVEIELNSRSPLHEVALADHLPALLEQTQEGWRRTFAPFEAVLLESGPQPDNARKELPPRAKARLGGPTAVRTMNPNLVRLNDWELSLLDSGGRPYQTMSVQALPLANQLSAGGFFFRPQWEMAFGLQPRLAMPRFNLRYTCAFENAFHGQVRLVMEPGSIVGEWQLTVNDSEPYRASDFTVSNAHVRGSLALDITRHMRWGCNTVNVVLQTDRMDGGLLNPLYLAGTFGVTLNPLGLVDRPVVGTFEAYERNGLPFYSGVIEYRLPVDIESLPSSGEVLVTLESDLSPNEAMEVSFNGSPFQPVLWQPRAVLMPIEHLRRGQNQAVVRVYSTLIRAFEGQWFDETTHAYQKIASRQPKP